MWRCDFREKRIVLIVSVLLPINIDLALCSNTQRRVDVLRMCQVPILQGVTRSPRLWSALAMTPNCRRCGPCVQPCRREACPWTATGVSQRWFSGHFDRCSSTPMHYPAFKSAPTCGANRDDDDVFYLSSCKVFISAGARLLCTSDGVCVISMSSARL